MPYGVRCASEQGCLLACFGQWFGVARSENCPFSLVFKAAFVSDGKVAIQSVGNADDVPVDEMDTNQGRVWRFLLNFVDKAQAGVYYIYGTVIDIECHCIPLVTDLKAFIQFVTGCPTPQLPFPSLMFTLQRLLLLTHVANNLPYLELFTPALLAIIPGRYYTMHS